MCMISETDKAYAKLDEMLNRAYDQAAIGKGSERHGGDGVPFHEQPMFSIMDLVGAGFATGQAMKKAQEAMRLSPDRAVHELLGAINFLAGAAIYIERNGSVKPKGM